MPRETFGTLGLVPKRVLHKQWDKNEIKHHFKIKNNDLLYYNNDVILGQSLNDFNIIFD